MWLGRGDGDPGGVGDGVEQLDLGGLVGEDE